MVEIELVSPVKRSAKIAVFSVISKKNSVFYGFSYLMIVEKRSLFRKLLII